MDTDFNTETEFAYSNVGYGIISYEAGDDFIKIVGDRLFTETFDRGDGMQWNGQRWMFDGGLGLQTLIMKKADMTPKQIAEAWGEDHE